MAWPSTISSFSNPIPTDRLNNPSHSSIETAQNTGLTELQTYIGVNTGINASTVGTLLYDIKAPDSNGGGHIQTAIKGGTGQTSFTKGDLLVATNATTISKFAVGVDNQILAVNSSTATGVNWVPDTNNKLFTSTSIVGVSIAEVSIMSTTLQGSALGITNAIRTTVKYAPWQTRTGNPLIARALYGGNVVASVVIAIEGADSFGIGEVQHTMLAGNATNLQKHFLEVTGTLPKNNSTSSMFQNITVNPENPFNPSIATQFRGFMMNTSSVNSSAPQTLGMTLIVTGGNSQLNVNGVISEKNKLMTPKTLVIDNFQGRLTRYTDGDINSGYAKYSSTFGNDPFTEPGNLTWFETPIRIDSSESVITDLIVAARPRLEGTITYVYAVGHTGRFYKIQVNDPTTFNPNYDTPTLITTLTINTPTFKYGASINFFGSVPMVYIGHDKGMTKINFDGTGEAEVGAVGSWTQDVPRPSVQFGASLYVGAGTNLAEVIAGGTVATYTKLSPGFPTGTQVRDVDVSPDGNYVQIIVSRVSAPDMTVTTQDTSSLSSSDSYRFLWNGVDIGATSYETFNSYSINSNLSFGPYSYTMGYDLGNTAVYTGGQKIVSLPNSLTPNFGALFSTGNLLGFGAPEEDSGFLKGTLMTYGQYDNEIPAGLFRFFRLAATNSQTDIIQMPYCGIVSNLFYGSSSAGYSGNQVGSAKVYFSTLETSASTTKYKLYKFTTVPTGLGSAIAGTYETQTQLFSKKIKVSQARIYGKPWVANNAFTVSLIGSGGTPISGSSQTFTAGSNLTIGDDFAWYSPAIEPTYALGLRITNVGTANNTITKCEIDTTSGGI